MTLTSLAVLAALVAFSPTSAHRPVPDKPAAPIQRQMLTLDDGSGLRYAIAVPDTYDENEAAPLILAFHFGWGEALPSNYGAIFIEILVEQALRELGAIIVALNCPGRSWVEPRSEDAVLALLDHVRDEYNVDPDRIVVTGFSLGGTGTWYFASRHADMLSAAIPVASVPIVTGGSESGRGAVQRFRAAGSVDWPPSLLELPMYVLHSRQDELLPIGPVEAAVAELAAEGADVEFLAIDGIGHHETPRYVPFLAQTVSWIQRVWGER